jgi:hypothetical protein
MVDEPAHKFAVFQFCKAAKNPQSVAPESLWPCTPEGSFTKARSQGIVIGTKQHARVDGHQRAAGRRGKARQAEDDAGLIRG